MRGGPRRRREWPRLGVCGVRAPTDTQASLISVHMYPHIYPRLGLGGARCLCVSVPRVCAWVSL
jgi:hypothetical protein